MISFLWSRLSCPSRSLLCAVCSRLFHQLWFTFCYWIRRASNQSIMLIWGPIVFKNLIFFHFGGMIVDSNYWNLKICSIDFLFEVENFYYSQILKSFLMKIISNGQTFYHITFLHNRKGWKWLMGKIALMYG